MEQIMKDDTESRTGTRIKAVAIFAAVAVFFVVIRLLPTEWPLFPAKDSMFHAERLLRDGKCEEGYDIYEKKAEKEVSAVTYLSIGDWKYAGKCGGQDLPGAIAAYRKAARKGNCSANFYLAELAIKHPDVHDVEHASPANNLFASVICAYPLTDSELSDFFLNRGDRGRNVDVVKKHFLAALRQRDKFNFLSFDQRIKTVKNIRDGIGYDANPVPYKDTKALRP